MDDSLWASADHSHERYIPPRYISMDILVSRAWTCLHIQTCGPHDSRCWSHDSSLTDPFLPSSESSLVSWTQWREWTLKACHMTGVTGVFLTCVHVPQSGQTTVSCKTSLERMSIQFTRLRTVKWRAACSFFPRRSADCALSAVERLPTLLDTTHYSQATFS